jgi:diguanylate cyclase (GGDEF)-like protein/hemerythrin-like metal-binding protein/PAS domain S-box-containing protein
MNSVEVFPWNKNFETGLRQIDEQHQQLVRLLNTLASHLAFQSDAPTLSKVFDELANYAVFHFKSEEEIWHKFFGEDATEKQHRRTHASFIESVLKLKAGENTKPLDEVFEDVLLFLTHWLAFHILEEDMRMAKVVQAMLTGMALNQAKLCADQEMSGAMKVLIETVLTMYDTLSARTMQLAREIAERKRTQEKLRLAANVVENTLDSICITDAEGRVLEANPSFYESTGFNAEEVLSHSLKNLKSGLADEQLSASIWSKVGEGEHWSGELPNRNRNGEIEHEWLTLSSIQDEHGDLSNYVAVFSNITHLIKRQRKLERIAHHDSLTGLPNRLLLADRLEQALVHARRTREFVAICFLDLDGFKAVNDSLGHAAGDELLKEIAQRLARVVRDSDTIARIGGDEFMLILGEMKNADDYKVLLDRALVEIALPVTLGSNSVRVTASIGVTVYPTDASAEESLVKHADEAMYQAKKMGKSRYCLYEPEIENR